MEKYNVLKPAEEGDEETKNTETTVIASGGQTFHKLNFIRIPEPKKRSKPPIGMNALSRNNVKKEFDDTNEESKGEMQFSSDPKETNNGKGGSCPTVSNVMRDQESKIGDLI